MALYLVTGGAGFIGSHLVHALVARGDRVRVLDDLSTGTRDNLRGLEVGALDSDSPVELHVASITDADACRSACRGVRGVLHEAAQVSVPRSVEDPRASYAVNVTGTLNLLEAAREHAVRKFVFAASSAAYGDSVELPKREDMLPTPLSPYASGKIAAEHLLQVFGRVYGLQTVALRYFNVFGPRQLDDSPYTGVIALFARALLEGRRPTIFGDGQQTRDFTYIDNVVDANLAALDRELETGLVINVGSGERISVLALFARMAELLESDLTPIHAPARAGDVRDSLASLDLARRHLSYAPRVHWRDGLATTVEWYRARHGHPVRSARR
ncbi:MAG: SDR family oxidoreductase [Planctomycetota bacterium]